jgi:hypothetical protein
MHLPEDTLLKNLYWRTVWHRPLCEAIVLKTALPRTMNAGGIRSSRKLGKRIQLVGDDNFITTQPYRGARLHC